MPADNTRVLSNELEEAEFIDQTCWVPKGEELIPAHMFLNRHAVATGTRFFSTNASIADRLLQSRLIEQEHHAVAIRLMNLYRLGTVKQDYAVMKLFAIPHGVDNSEFCPITMFIRVTSSLRRVYYHWVRALCGLEEAPYGVIAANADLLRYALEKVGENFAAIDDAATAMTAAETHEYR